MEILFKRPHDSDISDGELDKLVTDRAHENTVKTHLIPYQCETHRETPSLKMEFLCGIDVIHAITLANLPEQHTSETSAHRGNECVGCCPGCKFP